MKNIKLIISVLLITFLATSCETYDDYSTARPVIAGFTKSNDNVKVSNGGTRDRKVDIFISESANVDRTFNVSVVADGSTAAAENYDFDSTVVIPANERIAEFVFTGIDVSLSDEKTQVILQVDPKDGVLSGSTYTAVIFK